MQKITEVFKKIESNKAEAEFLKTGFSSLDDMLDGGFLRKELIIIGGGTGQGKSYLAGQIFNSIAEQGFACAYFSLEIANEMVVARLAGAKANIKPTRVQVGFLTPDEYKTLQEAKVQLKTYEEFMFFYDNLYELADLVKEIRANHFDFVVVDFIQNVITDGESENMRMNKTALYLQQVAKEANCAILVLSQLSNVVNREGGKSNIVEYRGSGAIAMVADLGFMLLRAGEMTAEGIQQVKLVLKKNRRGSSGWEVLLNFQAPGGLMYE